MPREESNSAPSPHHSRRRRAAETGGSASAASHPIAFDQKLTTSNRKSFNLIFYRFRSIFLRTRNHKILIFSLSLLSYQWGWISSLGYFMSIKSSYVCLTVFRRKINTNSMTQTGMSFVFIMLKSTTALSLDTLTEN